MNREIKNRMVIFPVFIILFCIYIFPIGLIDPNYTYSKLIFVLSIVLCYLFSLKHMRMSELVYIMLIIILSILSKNFNYFVFLTIPYLGKLLKEKDTIKAYLLTSNILYICFFFTIIYSIIFAGTNGRYAFTAIKEINQSGLALFCLGMMFIKKNRKIGIFILLFGFLTFSRSYYLAILVCLLSRIKFVKKVISQDKVIKFFNYTNLTIISSVILILLGAFYIQQYKLGNIVNNDFVSKRILNFLDYSNFFRFTAIINIIFLFKSYPQNLLFGVTRSQYIEMGYHVASDIGIPYKYVVPHNLFYSHLKIYGIFSVIETVYISKIIQKIINKENILVFFAIVLYSFILGAGLYSYWLYLSSFVLLIRGEGEYENTNN